MSPTVAKMLSRLARAQEMNRYYRTRIWKLTQGRDEWKRKYQAKRRECTDLRARLRDARRQRDLWRHRALHARQP